MIAEELSIVAGLQRGLRHTYAAQAALVSCWSMRPWPYGYCHQLWRCAISAIQVREKQQLDNRHDAVCESTCGRTDCKAVSEGAQADEMAQGAHRVS